MKRRSSFVARARPRRPAPSVVAAELVERIVARVNDRLITQSEYDKRLAVAAKRRERPTDLDELPQARFSRT